MVKCPIMAAARTFMYTEPVVVVSIKIGKHFNLLNLILSNSDENLTKESFKTRPVVP
jgi:hypothetical protein